jgi:hypothetical protein
MGHRRAVPGGGIDYYGVLEMPNPGLRLTTHFDERWEERVGAERPTPKEVAALIGESIQLQKPRDLFTPRGYRFRVMAVYWHPGRQIVIKVDERNNRAVTVLTPKVLEGMG